MKYGTREWHPFTYDQIHVHCGVVHLVPNDFESVIVPYNKVYCTGRLWYRWDENTKTTLDTCCDKCITNFHCDQLELL